MKTVVQSWSAKNPQSLSDNTARRLVKKGFQKNQILENRRKMYLSHYSRGNNRLLVLPNKISITPTGGIDVEANPEFPSTLDSNTFELVMPALHEKQQQLSQAIEINHGKIEKLNLDLQETDEYIQDEKRDFIHDLKQSQIPSPSENKKGAPPRKHLVLLILLFCVVVVGELASLFFPLSNFLGIDLSQNFLDAISFDPIKSVLTFCFSLILFGFLLLLVHLMIWLVRTGYEPLKGNKDIEYDYDPVEPIPENLIEDAIIIEET